LLSISTHSSSSSEPPTYRSRICGIINRVSSNGMSLDIWKLRGMRRMRNDTRSFSWKIPWLQSRCTLNSAGRKIEQEGMSASSIDYFRAFCVSSRYRGIIRTLYLSSLRTLAWNQVQLLVLSSSCDLSSAQTSNSTPSRKSAKREEMVSSSISIHGGRSVLKP
jgi:hypothetical protein